VSASASLNGSTRDRVSRASLHVRVPTEVEAPVTVDSDWTDPPSTPPPSPPGVRWIEPFPDGRGDVDCALAPSTLPIPSTSVDALLHGLPKGSLR
jgi:hypothetical protein